MLCSHNDPVSYMCALNNDELALDTYASMSQLQARRVIIKKVGEVTINISLPKGHEVLITHQKTAPEMRHHVYSPWIRRRRVICTVKPSFNSSLTSSVVNCQPLVTTPSKCFCVETDCISQYGPSVMSKEDGISNAMSRYHVYTTTALLASNYWKPVY